MELQCAQYFPEEMDQREAYGGWQVACTSVREVDSDVSRRDLVVTPPGAAGSRACTPHMHHLLNVCAKVSSSCSLQGNLRCHFRHTLIGARAPAHCGTRESVQGACLVARHCLLYILFLSFSTLCLVSI